MKMVFTLCPKCRQNFALKPNTIIRRADYNQKHKEPCCFCQVRFGYDYIIEEKPTLQIAKSHIC